MALLQARLGGDRGVPWLLALAALPADEGLTTALSSALHRYGCADESRERLRPPVLAQPESAALQDRWFRLCLADGAHEEIEAQLAHIEATLPALAHWCRASQAFELGRFEAVGPPAATTPAQLDRLLESLRGDRALCRPSLAAAAGVPLHQHEALVARYEL